MSAPQKSPGARDSRNRSGAQPLGRPLAKQSQRQKRLELNLSTRDGYRRCPQCGKEVAVKADGSLRGHRSQGTIPCLGEAPTR